MTKSERTRQFIIEKTAPAFNMYGYEATSLSVLQALTGLTKGSLYGNFKDKEEIALEAFKYSMRSVREFFSQRIAKKKTARAKIWAFISVYSQFVFHPPIPGGCPLLNTAIEADDGHTAMRKVVSDEIAGTINFIASLFDEGKRNGEFQSEVKSKDLAYMIFTGIEGALMVSRVSLNDASMKSVVKHFKDILDQISK